MNSLPVIAAGLFLAAMMGIIILLLTGIRSDRKEKSMKGFDDHLDNYGNPGMEPDEIPAIDGYISERCEWCGVSIWGTADDIDSGLRKHQEYCESAPDDESEMQPMIPVELSGEEIDKLREWFGPGAEERAGEKIRSLVIAYDPIDRAIKFKINGYSWSPPMGEAQISPF